MRMLNLSIQKHFLLLAAALLSQTAKAQTYVGALPGYDLDVIPRQMSDQQSTYICGKRTTNGVTTIEILNENLETVNQFDIAAAVYNSTYKYEERERTLGDNGASISYIGEADTWEAAQTIIKNHDGGELVDRSEDSPFKMWEYSWVFPYQLWPAPSRIYDFVTIGGGGNPTRAPRKSNEDYTGLYPCFIYDWSPDTKEVRKVYLYYREVFRGDWVIRQEESGKNGRVESSYFVDYDDTSGTRQQFFVTQTLFNDDSDFEVIIPYYDEASTRVLEEDRDGDGVIDARTTYTGDKIIGYIVLSENGTAICDFTPQSGYHFGPISRFVKMNGNYYAIISMETDDGHYSYGFYKIDRETSSVQQVKSVDMGVKPTIADKSDIITVTLPDDSTAKEVKVVNSQGQTLRSIPVNGQKQVSFSAQGLSQGVNIVSAPDGSSNNSCKILVK